MHARRLLGQRGAAAVEFAVVLPLLLVILFGIVEFSLLFYDKAMITNASREGARAGVVYRYVPQAGTTPGFYNPLTQGEVDTVVDTYLSTFLITFASSPTPATTTLRCFTDSAYTTSIDCTARSTNGRDTTGYWIEVEVGYVYDFLVIPDLVGTLPGVGPWLQQVLNMNAITRMRME